MFSGTDKTPLLSGIAIGKRKQLNSEFKHIELATSESKHGKKTKQALSFHETVGNDVFMIFLQYQGLHEMSLLYLLYPKAVTRYIQEPNDFISISSPFKKISELPNSSRSYAYVRALNDTTNALFYVDKKNNKSHKIKLTDNQLMNVDDATQKCDMYFKMPSDTKSLQANYFKNGKQVSFNGISETFYLSDDTFLKIQKEIDDALAKNKDADKISLSGSTLQAVLKEHLHKHNKVIPLSQERATKIIHITDYVYTSDSAEQFGQIATLHNKSLLIHDAQNSLISAVSVEAKIRQDAENANPSWFKRMRNYAGNTITKIGLGLATTVGATLGMLKKDQQMNTQSDEDEVIARAEATATVNEMMEQKNDVINQFMANCKNLGTPRTAYITRYVLLALEECTTNPWPTYSQLQACYFTQQIKVDAKDPVLNCFDAGNWYHGDPRHTPSDIRHANCQPYYQAHNNYCQIDTDFSSYYHFDGYNHGWKIGADFLAAAGIVATTGYAIYKYCNRPTTHQARILSEDFSRLSITKDLLNNIKTVGINTDTLTTKNVMTELENKKNTIRTQLAEEMNLSTTKNLLHLLAEKRGATIEKDTIIPIKDEETSSKKEEKEIAVGKNSASNLITFSALSSSSSSRTSSSASSSSETANGYMRLDS